MSCDLGMRSGTVETNMDTYTHIVFDMASLTFRVNSTRTFLSVLAPTGERLASLEVSPADSDADLVYIGCERAIEAGKVSRARRRISVGLYNPFTGQFAFGGQDVFVASQPSRIEASGTLASRDGDAVTLADGSTVHRWNLDSATPNELSRVWAAASG